MTAENACRRIIVIGASAGGVEALRRLVCALPAGLPAAVCVVLHIGESSVLPQILENAGDMPAAHGRNGEEIEAGRIYVAPPDRHLLVHDGHLLLRRGPKENLARPAVDPLFRSAACSFGGGAIGVILTGSLNDGTAGLAAVKRCGGVAIVQDPGEALAPSMPQSALDHVDVDYCVTLDEIGPLLARLAAAPARAASMIPPDIQMETIIAAQEYGTIDQTAQLGVLSEFVCPECQGPLWEVADETTLRYRCHVGHALTGETALAGQSEEIERSLWRLMRAHEQRAALARRMAQKAETRPDFATRLQQRALDYEEDAALMRRLLRTNGGRTDAEP